MQLATIDLKVCPHCEQCNRRGHSRTSFPHTTIVVLGGGTYLYSTYIHSLAHKPPSTTSHGPGGTMCRYLLLLLLCLAILLARPSTAIDWSLVDVHRNRIEDDNHEVGQEGNCASLAAIDWLHFTRVQLIASAIVIDHRDGMGQGDRTGQDRTATQVNVCFIIYLSCADSIPQIIQCCWGYSMDKLREHQTQMNRYIYYMYYPSECERLPHSTWSWLPVDDATERDGTAPTSNTCIINQWRSMSPKGHLI